MAITSFASAAGGTDEGGELIASFSFTSSGSKFLKNISAGTYLLRIYASVSSAVNIYTTASNVVTKNSLISISSGVTDTTITFASNIDGLFVNGTNGSFVIRKLQAATPSTLTMSVDPSTWTSASYPPMMSAAYGEGKFIGVSTATTATPFKISTDGEVWTASAATVTNLNWRSIIYSSANNSWCAGASASGGLTFARSTDGGTTWTTSSATLGAGTHVVMGMAAIGSTIIAPTALYGAYKTAYSSNDGVSWSSVN